MSQAGPLAPGDENWQPLPDRFFDRTLHGVDNGVATELPVLTEGRPATRRAPASAPRRMAAVRHGDAPLPDRPNGRSRGGRQGLRLLQRPDHDRGAVDPDADAEPSWLFFQGEPLARTPA